MSNEQAKGVNALTQIETDANDIMNALKNKRKVIIDEVDNLKTAVDERVKKGFKNKLPFLVGHLTKVSKRKTLESEHDGQKLGINCNGLGYEGKWGSQLNPLCEDRSDGDMLFNILINTDLSLEISQEIVSSNRTNFLKLANHLKKLPMPTKDLDNIKVNDKVEITFNDAEPMILVDGEEVNDNFLNNGVKIFYDNRYELTLRDFLDAEIVIANADAIADAIKKATKQIKEKTKQEAETGLFVNELSNVFEAVAQI